MQNIHTSHKEISTAPRALVLNASAFTFWACFSLYFTHWIGVQKGAAVFIVMLYLALLIKLYSAKVRVEFLILGCFISSYVVLVILIQTPSFDDFVKWSPIGTPRLLFQAVSMFLVFAFISLLRPLYDDKLCRFFRYSYNLFAITIAAEWVLVNVLGFPVSLMPAFRDSPSYASTFESYYRPFGLTGSAPVNGAMLVMALWVLVSCDKTIRVGRYIILTGVILYLNNSGQAYLTFFLSVIYYYFSQTRGIRRYALTSLFVTGVGCILFSGVLTKFSFDYVLTMLRFLGLDAIAAMDLLSQIMGGYGTYAEMFGSGSFVTEFYPIYSVTNFGFLLTLMTWLYILFRLPKKNKGLIFLVLLVGSLHYPMVLFVETQILLGAYIFWVPKNNKKELATA